MEGAKPMGRWSFTNVGASASLQNVKYVKKIFEYMGYSEETDGFFSEQCGFKKPPVYYCMSSEDPRIEEQIHQVAALDRYDMEGFDAETDLPFKSNSAREYAEQIREQCRKDTEQYISDMKEACAEGKAVWEMVERARTHPLNNVTSENFKFAVQNLDIYADISFYEKHFALSGLGTFEGTVKQEIEKRGGIVHSSMLKKCDYLIVRLEDICYHSIYKVQKALEWREKGADNRIVTDYQLWQAIYQME